MDIAVLAYSTRMGYEKFGFLAAKDYWFDNNFRRRFFKYLINLIISWQKIHPFGWALKILLLDGILI